MDVKWVYKCEVCYKTPDECQCNPEHNIEEIPSQDDEPNDCAVGNL